jgi:crotonobetainyl-CoA:carnitine CoA-transferase CaiB-like acyl-CoA transferase
MDAHGLAYERLAQRHAGLIMISVTPFGLTGPHADYRASDLVLWSAGGAATLNGDPGHPELPPLKPFGDQAGFQAGLNAAIPTLAALLARETTGLGDHIDVSAQEAVASILELTLEFWPYCGLVASRLGAKPIQPLCFMECRDGWIFICCVEEHQWRTLVEIMGEPEWAHLELFENRLARGANFDALQVFLQEWCAEQSVVELYEKAQRRRVPLAPVSSMGDLLASPHLKTRGFFAVIDQPGLGEITIPGAPYRLSRTPWTLRRPAPRLGQHTAEVLEPLGIDVDALVRQGAA